MEQDAQMNFKNLIKQHIKISDDKIDQWIGLFTAFQYKEGDYYSTPDQPSQYLAFVVKGLFRLYVIDQKGNEATLAFTGDHMFMSAYGAIVLDQNRPIYIQALEDCQVYCILRKDFLALWEKDIETKDFLQKMTELDCLRIRKRELEFLLDDAQTRYLNFLKDFSKYENRIKIRYIASYLGISPETLSRIRSNRH